MKRWDVAFGVEDTAPSFDVGADKMKIHKSGALQFYIDGEMILAYGPGQWATVAYLYEE
ncbi:hypothetical protein C8K36_102457 [Rhodococcus sp. OK519]|uniref:hypothetical protein n=1 Tax=Rhodococcus sp. OK519 TaxID=2135729 RepID=UPI000D4CB0AA|nr:hypothetical protein C8K36_102457 [Rhodococcus sp. OK519]